MRNRNNYNAESRLAQRIVQRYVYESALIHTSAEGNKVAIYVSRCKIVKQIIKDHREGEKEQVKNESSWTVVRQRPFAIIWLL